MGEEEEKPTKEEEKKSYLQELKELKKGIEEGNIETARLIAEQKELIAQGVLSGDFNKAKEPETKEETPEEYSKKLIEGKVEDAS